MNIPRPRLSHSKVPFLLFIGFWILTILFNLGLIGAIIWVAWHFISKFW